MQFDSSFESVSYCLSCLSATFCGGTTAFFIEWALHLHQQLQQQQYVQLGKHILSDLWLQMRRACRDALCRNATVLLLLLLPCLHYVCVDCSSNMPLSGGAYSYISAVFGELLAWITVANLIFGKLLQSLAVTNSI